MRNPDSAMRDLIAKLAAMPMGTRSEILSLLTAAERARLDDLMRPKADADEAMSSSLATLIEELRFGSVVGITDRARTALIHAAGEVGNHCSVTMLDVSDMRPSLLERARAALGFRK